MVEAFSLFGVYDFILCIELAFTEQVHCEVQQPFHVQYHNMNGDVDVMKVTLFG